MGAPSTGIEKEVLREGVTALCPGCNKVRKIRYRGVCQTCGKKKIKGLPDRRRRDVWGTPDVDYTNCEQIVLDQELCPRGVIWRMARNVAYKFWPKVFVEDLVQTAYVVLLKSVKSWINAGRPGVSLTQYAKRGVVAAMYAVAQADATRGVHDLIKNLFDTPDRRVKVSSLRGGLNTPTQLLIVRDIIPPREGSVIVTSHALKRYRKRFNPSGIASDVLNKLPYAHVAPQWMWGCIGKKLQRADLLLQYKDMVFAIIKRDLHWGEYRPVVLTVMTLDSLEKRRAGIDWIYTESESTNV